MATRERILEAALEMFSERGFGAVSIRNICGEVGIKESTVYYHFKNKQDILDCLMARFEEHVDALLGVLRSALPSAHEGLSFDWMDAYFFEQYLFDPFCNRMMRLMMIEQFHNEQLRAAYERWLFEEPYAVETSAFRMLSEAGLLSEAEAARTGRDFHAFLTTMTFRYLLNGELTQDKKEAFRREVHSYMASLFARRGGEHV
ncbi:MAG: TetR/AcrR family transcriptional regulator [Christensenellales bacterium]|jgi:AcrR family transcriptional regulator